LPAPAVAHAFGNAAEIIRQDAPRHQLARSVGFLQALHRETLAKRFEGAFDGRIARCTAEISSHRLQSPWQGEGWRGEQKSGQRDHQAGRAITALNRTPIDQSALDGIQ